MVPFTLSNYGERRGRCASDGGGGGGRGEEERREGERKHALKARSSAPGARLLSTAITFS